jgi:prepilin-type processing-associated H-X9-DG protein
VRTTKLKVYTCPADTHTGVFDVLDAKGVPLTTAATNSYAGSFGSLGNVTLGVQPGNGLLFCNSKVKFADITDGTSHTLAVGERAALFARTPWVGTINLGTVVTTPTAPVFEAVVLPATVMPVARVGHRKLHDPWAEPYDFFSPHSGLVQFAFADGSVQAIRTSLHQHVIQSLATRDGGELMSNDW